jgi:hypothetical protein
MDWFDSFSSELCKIASTFSHDRRAPISARKIEGIDAPVHTYINIQKHDAARAGKHYDLRIQDPRSKKLLSWAIPKSKLPEHDQKVLAIRQPDHNKGYLGWRGTIDSKYGKGKVQSTYLDKERVNHMSPGKVEFELEGKSYLLHRTLSNKNWLLRRKNDS